MDDEIAAKISKEWNLSSDIIKQYSSFFTEHIKPIIKTNYLSHLVTTIENMVNDKRMTKFIQELERNIHEGNIVDREKLRGLLASRTFRLYSIVREPIILKRRATTRHHPSGAIIYYNSNYDEKTIRILIAHELGHIVNKELFENPSDSEQTANLFAYIAMDDKNKFYMEGSDRFKSKSDIQILNDIICNCPI
jgi:Zn-dependent peptidase ImmA (M78 family)